MIIVRLTFSPDAIIAEIVTPLNMLFALTTYDCETTILYIISFTEKDDLGWITRKKNLIAETAKFENLAIVHDRIFFETDWYEDDRGFFKELYKKSAFGEGCGCNDFVQVNYSYSKKHVLRGLHYQKKPEEQGKLIMVNKGKIFDVAVDLRRASDHFGKWVGVEITASNNKMLYIPPGFAHGFCVLSEEAGVQYFCTKEYSPDHERGIIWNDPDIGVEWPVKEPVLSDKDKSFGSLSEADNNF